MTVFRTCKFTDEAQPSIENRIFRKHLTTLNGFYAYGFVDIVGETFPAQPATQFLSYLTVILNLRLRQNAALQKAIANGGANKKRAGRGSLIFCFF